MNRRLLVGLSFLVLVSAGCASTADETTTTTTAPTTTTTTATSTTTTLPATTTTEVVEPVAAPAVPAGPLSLPAYLGLTYRLDGDFTQGVLEAGLNATPEDPLGGQVVLYEEYVAALSSIDPPEEAAAYHAQLLALMQRALDITRDAQAKFDIGDQAAVLEAAEELIALGGEMIQASFAIGDEQAAVVMAFLERYDDPETAYLLELMALRNSDNTRALESLLSGATSPDITLEELAELYGDLVALFEATLAAYRSLDPPESWKPLYDRQVELLEDGIVIYAAIAEAIETDTEADLDTLLALLEITQRGPELNADVLTKAAEHFETLDAPLVSGSLPVMPRDTPIDMSATGLAIPTVSGNDFNGQPVTIEDDGRPKAIVFLAHWCPHCQAEVPSVQAWLNETRGVEGVDMYSVATAVEPTRGNYPPSRWLLQEGWTVPVVRDHSDDPILVAFGNGGFPFWVFTNSDGTVAVRVAGEIPIAELEAILMGLE